MARRKTDAERRSEVDSWRASGESIGRYAARRGFSATTLKRWVDASAEQGGRAPALVRLLVGAAEPQVVGLDEAVVVEVKGARIRVGRRFDPALLRAVVVALTEVSS